VFVLGTLLLLPPLGLLGVVLSYVVASGFQAGFTCVYQLVREGMCLSALTSWRACWSIALLAGGVLVATDPDLSHQVVYTVCALVIWLGVGTGQDERAAVVAKLLGWLRPVRTPPALGTP
jgi:hypothetical protein